MRFQNITLFILGEGKHIFLENDIKQGQIFSLMLLIVPV